MIIGASGGSAPEWLETSRAPPSAGTFSIPSVLDPEPVAVVEVEHRVCERESALVAPQSSSDRSPSASGSSSPASSSGSPVSSTAGGASAPASGDAKSSARASYPERAAPPPPRRPPRAARPRRAGCRRRSGGLRARAVRWDRPLLRPLRPRAGSRERQLDDLGAVGVAVADLDRCPRLRLAAEDRERDRAAGGGDDGGADLPELALAEPDRVAAGGGRRRGGGRVGGGSACPCSAAGRPSPGRCSSPW